MPPEPSTRLLRPSVVYETTTLDRATIWRKVKEGTFPQPLKISGVRIAWRHSDIEAWIAALTPDANTAGV